MLTKLKSQYSEKLNGLSNEEIIVPKPTDNNQLPVDHVLLLKDYFRGRDDVYAKMWINNRTGKRGYSPVCRNEWVRSLCRKPAIKCSECPNQQFLPFDEVATRQHLEGRQVIGVYPMLRNESCHFLAIDFDGSTSFDSAQDRSLTTGKENWLDDILVNVDEGRFPLILTERREYLEILGERLRDKIDFLAVLYGGMGRKNQREIFEQIKESDNNTRRAILATGSYIGEGFDEPRLDTLFLTMPSSFKGKIVQYAGRLYRYHQDKHDIRIYDYVDPRLPVLERMFKRRSKTYKLLGYEIKDQLGG